MPPCTTCSIQPLDNWDDFLILSKQVPPNCLFFIVSSQLGHISYVRQLTRLPYYWATYFTENSFLLLFPHQLPLAAIPEEAHGVKGQFKELLGRRKEPC